MNETFEILLVDDTPDNINLIIAYCKGTPHLFTQAANGEEALTLLKVKKFDLVLMDLQMPIMDGHTAIKLFRDWEKEMNREKTFIAVLTAYHVEEERVKSFEAGCDLFITKPVKKGVILETIDKVRETRSAPQT